MAPFLVKPLAIGIILGTDCHIHTKAAPESFIFKEFGRAAETFEIFVDIPICRIDESFFIFSWNTKVRNIRMEGLRKRYDNIRRVKEGKHYQELIAKPFLLDDHPFLPFQTNSIDPSGEK